MKTHRIIALICTLYIYIGTALAQPYTFQDRDYDYMFRFDFYRVDGSNDWSIIFEPLTIYLSRYGQMTIDISGKVITDFIKETTGLIKEIDIITQFHGEHFKLVLLTAISQGSSFGFSYQNMNYTCINTNRSQIDALAEIHTSVLIEDFLLGTGGAPLSAKAREEQQARAREEAERREQERKQREAAEEARRKALEEEMRRRKEEEERFRAQPLSARTDAVRVPTNSASFPGGEAKLQEYLKANMKYPVIARDEGIQGSVIVQFIVEPDGSFSSVTAVKSPDPILSKEAIRLIKSMPLWYPAFHEGKRVPSVVTQVIRFTL